MSAPPMAATAVDTSTPTPPPPTPPPGPDRGGNGGSGFTPPPVPTRERSLLGRITVGVALMTVGVLWILETVDVLALGTMNILAIGLAVIGVGLLVGAFVGRARWLIVVGLLLLPLVVVGTVLRGLPIGFMFDARTPGNQLIGERLEEPRTLDELADGYSVGAGRLDVDITGLDLTGLEPTDDVVTRLQMGAGEINVTVPDDVNVELRSSIGGGEIEFFERSRAGLAVDLNATREATSVAPEQAPTVVLEIESGFGQIVVGD